MLGQFIGAGIGMTLVVVLTLAITPGGVNFETGVDDGVLVRCGSSDWGDFEGEYPVIWVETDQDHFVYWFEYAPEFNQTLVPGEFYSFEYGYEYMPSGVSAGDGWWVKSLSRVRDSEGCIVWGDWWLW